MSALSWLSVLLLVFVHPVCTSESRRAADRWFTLEQNACTCPLECDWNRAVASPDTAPAPPIVLRFPHLSCELKARNKGGGYCGCVCACVCICVCALRVGGGCVKKKKKEEVLSGTEAFCRCCGEEWMESSVVISRAALSDSGRYATCGLIPAQSHYLSDGAIAEKVRGKRVTERWHEKIKRKVEGGREKKKRLKNMFTRGGWGWRRSLRFPSWRVSQSGGGWDSLLVPLDVTWGTLISVCLCLSPFLWPSPCLRSL